MVTEFDVRLDEHRILHGYHHGAGDTAVIWFHGTPNIGSPPAPLFADAGRLGLRFAGYDRPGYGGSTARPGRDIASAAADAEAVADALGLDRFAVLGHSGGGPHALAAAALLGPRVIAAVSISGLAPRSASSAGADRFAGMGPTGEASAGADWFAGMGATGEASAGADWFAGMGPTGEASLRAAAQGRAAKELHEAAATDAMPDFTKADWAALEGEWGWFGSVVEPAVAAGPAALIDDDLAYVADWGFDPAEITVPVLLVHGADDRVVPAAHTEWLATRIPRAEKLIIEGAGHISVLPSAARDSLEWIAHRRLAAA